LNITIGEDININYLDDDNTNKQKLDSLLATSNLFSIINFPARINTISMTASDKYRNKNFTINPLPNGLSDRYGYLTVTATWPLRLPGRYGYLAVTATCGRYGYLTVTTIWQLWLSDHYGYLTVMAI